LTIVIRPPVADDFAAWKVLWDGYNAFYGREGATALPPEMIQLTWSRIFDAKEPVHALVAEQAGRLLGITHYLFHRSMMHVADVCYLQDLFTAQDARGKGVGRLLIQGVYQRAEAAGSKRVYWHTHETNKTAMLLYDKLGERTGGVLYARTFP
jgi:GNAT superfamily N-acetyltransferase